MVAVNEVEVSQFQTVVVEQTKFLELLQTKTAVHYQHMVHRQSEYDGRQSVRL